MTDCPSCGGTIKRDVEGSGSFNRTASRHVGGENHTMGYECRRCGETFSQEQLLET